MKNQLLIILKVHLFAVQYLSFKPETDDMREAPFKIIKSIIDAGAIVNAYDPKN